MKTFIANFGRHNYLWPTCLERSTVATFEDEDMWALWNAGDKEGYIARCIAEKKTVKGLTPTRAVASRWYNLAHIISATENDLWIHRQKDKLWWTISGSDKVDVSIEAINDATSGSHRIYVFHKASKAWSNQTKNGNPLDWRGLHAKAREFLFTEGTLQQLSEDHAAYAWALIQGHDVSYWHALPAWWEKAAVTRKNPVTVFSAKQRAAVRMAQTARQTADASRGQQVLRTVKSKDLRFADPREFERFIAAVIDAQEGLCAISELPLQFDGECTDDEFKCSLDRIDSNGDYEDGNLQVVCKFVNRWKGSDEDHSFRRLICLVRRGGSRS